VRDKGALLVIAAIAALLLFPASALAFDEPHSQPETTTSGGTNHGFSLGRSCNDCHRADIAGSPGSEDCLTCHGGTMYGTPSPESGKGPHGVYSSVSDRCDACHDVHAAGGLKLLPSATVTASCFSCHDGTGGKGVYGAIGARGIAVGQAHRIDTTSTVPGGDPSTGGAATMAFKGLGGNLGCDDCHSPHDASTVATFTIERRRTALKDDVARVGVKTTRLLRRNPGGSVATATVYGSDWCLACHRGRSSAGPVHNHPVDSAAATSAAFRFERVAVLSADTPTSATTFGTLGQTNRGYLMPSPRTSQQAGHAPICQQCHADARDVGLLIDPGVTADAGTFTITAADGSASADNPRFQTFPHETVNAHLLVETNDDLCTNCHPPAVLP
jgi:predicted CXXCH cytochrome family protein